MALLLKVKVEKWNMKVLLGQKLQEGHQTLGYYNWYVGPKNSPTFSHGKGGWGNELT
jgi:hypothetical protein